MEHPGAAKPNTADLSFAKLIRHRGLLPADLIDRLTREAALAGVALADHAVDEHYLDPVDRDDMLRVRARHGRRCSRCHHTTHLLGAGDRRSTCEACGGALVRRHARLSDRGRAPADPPRRASGRVPASALAAAAAAPPPATESSVTRPLETAAPPPPDATPAPETKQYDVQVVASAPTPLEEFQQAAADTARDWTRRARELVEEGDWLARSRRYAAQLREGRDAGQVARALGAGAVAFLLLAGCLSVRAAFGGIHWQVSAFATEAQARKEHKFRVVCILNRDFTDFQVFKGRVFDDSRVLDLADRFIWVLDRGNAGGPDRRVDPWLSHYGGLPRGPNRILHIMIFNPEGQVVNGLLSAGNLTADEFVAMLEESLADPRWIVEKNKEQ